MTSMPMALHERLQGVIGPLETARGLPNACYTDRALFEEEKRRVFDATWACVGFAKDVPRSGDLKPISFLGRPLLLARGRDGRVRVFHNVCRHRGMQLVAAPCRRPMIACPYHSWTYELDGRLRATPHIGGPDCHEDARVDRAALSLFEARSQVWMDLVFVNLSGEAPTFADYAAALDSRWREFAARPLFHGGADSSFSLDLQGNWKLAVENYCESYHLPFVHPGLNSYSRLEDHYHIAEPGFSGQGSTVYAAKLSDDGRQFAPFDGLSEQWRSGAEYIALYPNVLLGVHRDHTYAIQLDPLDVDRTIERVEIYYAAAAMTGEDWSALRRRNSETWRGVFDEDVSVVEGMQRGRAAPAFDGGRFAPAMDGPTHGFHSWVARHLAEA